MEGSAVMARSGLPGRSAPAAPVTAPGTWIHVKGGGDTWWRCEAPAKAVGGKTLPVLEADARKAFEGPNTDTPFPWTIHLDLEGGGTATASTRDEWDKLCLSRTRWTGMSCEFPAVEGTVVWTRPDLNRAVLASHMRHDGIRTLAESDDNYFARSEQNLFLRQNEVTFEQKVLHARAMSLADGCVFSTDLLRDQYASFMRKHIGSVPEQLFVCRNHVPRDEWPTRSEHDGPLRVGFMGSPSHVWDVNRAYGAFLIAKNLGCETVMIGYNPADPDPNVPDYKEGETKSWRSEASIAAKTAWSSVVSKHIPWIDPGKYHRVALPLDIGLAPLLTDGFTRGKSDAKNLEYTISGAAIVCENHPAYNRAGWEHEVNCLMAADDRQFAEQTLRLIEDPKLRYELVTAAQEYVSNERNEEVLALEWGYALNG